MPLNKDILGHNLYEAAKAFNDKDIAPADLEAQREAFWKVIADEVIKHLTTAGTVPGLGLIAPSGGGPVTGAAQIH